MINDNLLATEATATLIFCAVSPMILKIDTNSTPITHAQGNQGVIITVLLTGKEPFTIEPVITQVM